MENNEVSHAARERLPRYWNIDNDWETWMQTVHHYEKLEFANIIKEMQRLYSQLVITYDMDTFNDILARMRVLQRKLKSISVWKLLIRQKVQITRSVSFDEGLDNYCRGKEI